MTQTPPAKEAAPEDGPTTSPDPSPPPAGLVALFRRLGPAGVLAIAWTAMPALGGIALLATIGEVSAWLQDHKAAGLGIYVLIFVFSAGFGALPTYSQSLLGGWAFGLVNGFLAAWAGFIGASMVGYVVARTVAKRRVERLIEENAKARAVRDALIGHGLVRTTAIVALLRVPPNSPFALTNLAMAASGVRPLPFVIGTAIGMAPRTLAAVWIAVEASKRGDNLIDVVKNRDLWQVIAMLVATAIVLGVIGAIAKRALAKVSRPKPASAEPISGVGPAR